MGTREIELKLELDLPSAEGLEGRISSQLGIPDEAARRLCSTYFDTRKHALQRRGVSLRLRKEGKRHLQTLKAVRLGGIFDRAEWESEVDGPNVDPAAFPSKPRQILKARRRIDPIFQTDVERTTWTVRGQNSAIEVSLDQGKILAGDAEAELAEVELELKEGLPRDLFGVARQLAQVGELRIGMRSKSERGYLLIEGRSPQAAKAEPIELARTMSVGQSFQVVARACVRHFRLNEPVLSATRDPDALHQSRVALRRLRSAFSLFQDAIADEDLDRLKKKLRSISALLGTARNLDVYRARVSAGDIAYLPAIADVQAYTDRIEVERVAAYDRVLRTLVSKRFRLFTVDLSGWIEAGPWLTREANSAVRDGSILDFAKVRLDQRRRAVRKKGRDFVTLEPAARHKLRIAAKKLRYASEFFATLAKGRDRRRRQDKFAARLETLQESLGDLNDISTGRELAAHFGVASAQVPGAGGQDERVSELIETAAMAHARFVDVRRFWR